MDEAGRIDHAPWPTRAILLALVGTVFGLMIHTCIEGRTRSLWTAEPLSMAMAAFLAVAGIAFAFGLERLRWTWTIGFAALTGLVVAFVAWWNGAPDAWGAGEGWQFFASLIAVAVALPLFQSVRDTGRFRFDATAILSHAWTNLILWGGTCAFVLASVLLTVLLGALFALIGIDLIEKLIRDGWFMAMLIGGAFGGAVGLLRDRDTVIETVHRVVRAILSVLAPVLAIGLVLFVVALPFTGLEPLWEKTRSTTPILLVSVLGPVVLANAVIGNRAHEEARQAILRWAAAALAIVILPLAAVAAISTGKRIGQYGFTPDRLWAAVFVTVALAFAGGYLFALLRGRGRWGEALRSANVRLAMAVCLLALFLALPIVSFGAISAHDQLARLERGRVTPDRFDWAAMRFDFGPAGRKGLEQLARSGPPTLRAKAAEALRATDRWALGSPEVEPAEQRRRNPPKLLLTPAGSTAPEPLVEAVALTGLCTVETCRLEMKGANLAVLVSQSCRDCAADAHVFERRQTGWERLQVREVRRSEEETGANALPAGPVEIRTVARRQVFIDDKPVGPALE